MAKYEVIEEWETTLTESDPNITEFDTLEEARNFLNEVLQKEHANESIFDNGFRFEPIEKMDPNYHPHLEEGYFFVGEPVSGGISRYVFRIYIREIDQ